MNIHIHEHMGIYLFNVYRGVELLEHMVTLGFPSGSNSKESACNESIPRSGRYPGEGNCYPLQYSCLEHSMDRGAWQATVHWVAKSQTQVSIHTQPSLWSNSHIHTWLVEKNIALTIWTFVSKAMSLLFNMLSRFVIAFLPRSKRLLISWLQSLSTVILETKKIKSVTVSIFPPSLCHELMGPNAMIFILECWILSQLFHSLSPSSKAL